VLNGQVIVANHTDLIIKYLVNIFSIQSIGFVEGGPMGIFRRYEWNHRGVRFQHEMTWPDEWLSRLEREPHDITDTSLYGHYVHNDPFEDELGDFFEDIIELGDQRFNFSGNKQVFEFLLSFVQSLRYYSEKGEYPRYPTETVIDKGGDCEDTAILMAFIADHMDYKCAFLQFNKEGFLGIGGFAHLDLGISPSYEDEFSGSYWTDDSGNKYFFVACNGKGWRIGQYSGSWGKRASVYPL
jgi:hypothetical protein